MTNPVISQAPANRLRSSIDGDLSRNTPPMVAMISATIIATTAIRLPDMTKTPAMRMIAKKNSNAWKSRIPEACSGAMINSMTNSSTVSAVSSGSLCCSRKRVMMSFMPRTPPAAVDAGERIRTEADSPIAHGRASRHPLALIGLLQSGDVELDHSHHRLHRALGAGAVRTAEIFYQRGRHDLPGHAKTVLQPAALLDRTALGQCAPIAIDLGLVGAVDLERDGVGEIERLAAVQRHEALAGQRELHHQHRTGLAGGAVDGVLLDVFDFRIRQQRHVEVCGLLGLAVEPQAGRDFRHRGIL